jgi:hypothetical protein
MGGEIGAIIRAKLVDGFLDPVTGIDRGLSPKLGFPKSLTVLWRLRSTIRTSMVGSNKKAAPERDGLVRRGFKISC